MQSNNCKMNRIYSCDKIGRFAVRTILTAFDKHRLQNNFFCKNLNKVERKLSGIKVHSTVTIDPCLHVNTFIKRKLLIT